MVAVLVVMIDLLVLLAMVGPEVVRPEVVLFQVEDKVVVVMVVV